MPQAKTINHWPANYPTAEQSSALTPSLSTMVEQGKTDGQKNTIVQEDQTVIIERIWSDPESAAEWNTLLEPWGPISTSVITL